MVLSKGQSLARIATRLVVARHATAVDVSPVKWHRRQVALSAAFISRLPDVHRARFDGAAGLEDALAEVLERARSAWPDLTIDGAAFSAHLARHVVDVDDLGTSLSGMRIEDLALAHAAGGGDTRALATFEKLYFGDITPAARRSIRTDAGLDELRQVLREKLFVRTPDREPSVLTYAGRGDLRGWMRVAIARTVLNSVTRGPKERSSDDDLFSALPCDDDDPEIVHLRAECRGELKGAFAEAIRSLETRDRNLLRHAFVDGLGVDAVGAIYGVHRATAARWLSAARARLMESLRTHLAERLRLEPTEIDSLLRWARSGVDITLERCFEKTA